MHSPIDRSCRRRAVGRGRSPALFKLLPIRSLSREAAFKYGARLLMRILYVSSVYKPAYVYGGPARSVPSLCEGLAESGVGIEVSTTNAHRRTRLDVPLNRRLEVDGVPVTYFPIVGERYFYAPALVEAARQTVQRFDLVEIDALFSALFEPVAAVCRRAGVPYVVPPRGQLLPWALQEKCWKKMFYLRLA